MPGEENGRQWLGSHRRPAGHGQRKGTGGDLDGQGPSLAGVEPEGFGLSTEQDFYLFIRAHSNWSVLVGRAKPSD